MFNFNASPSRRNLGAPGFVRASAAVTAAALALATLSGCGAASQDGGSAPGAETADTAGILPDNEGEPQAGKTLNEAGTVNKREERRGERPRGDQNSDALVATKDGHLAEANSAPKTTRPSAPSRLAVTGMEVSRQDKYDRVIINLDGDGEPGWFVDYVSSPVQQTVGAPLQVEGRAFLNVNIDGTVYPQDIGRGDVEANHADGAGSVVEVLNAGTSAGRSQIVIGLKKATPYSVQTLYNPTRLVIDIARD